MLYRMMLTAAMVAMLVCVANSQGIGNRGMDGSRASNQEPDVPRISARVAYEKYMSGKVILVDANPKYSYDEHHLLGAINLPNDGKKDLERIRRAKLPFGRKANIIVYCK